MTIHIDIDHKTIAEFCEKWRITEFSLFGSVIRSDFGPQSDVDVLVSFDSSAEWSLLDLVDMKEELEGIFHREVDLLTRRAVEDSPNWLRRESILKHTETLYHAA